MRLIEHDGKTMLTRFGVSVPRAILLPFDRAVWPGDEPWFGPCFIKPQILAGRRGKSGLIRRAERPEDVPGIIHDLTRLIGQTPCAGLLCEEEVIHSEEWLVAIDIDREKQGLRVTKAKEGGMGVSSAVSVPFTDFLQNPPEDVPQEIRRLVALLGQQLVKADALSIEINPLAKTVDGVWVALDAKIELDDLALDRHSEYQTMTHLSPFGRLLSQRERAYEDELKHAGHRGTLGKYIELDGTVALILSGGGASLAALDALRAAGLRPANYVELSGNPDVDSVLRAAQIVLSKPGIVALWIAGSFANFTDIHDTVQGVLRAVHAMGLHIPIVIRRDGPRADEAEAMVKTWAASYSAPVVFHRGDINLEASARVLSTLL